MAASISDQTLLPLVALLPCHPEFDEEAAAAAEVGLPVVRFHFDEELQIVDETSVLSLMADGCLALLRGFMLSGNRRRLLQDACAQRGIKLTASPFEYEDVHYYPNAYDRLAAWSPRATWQEVDPAVVGPETFANAVATVLSWQCTHVVLKDYVKSAKATGQRFMQVLADAELPDEACDFVKARGCRFNRGVVFKEHVELSRYATRGGYVTNEWRIWFMHAVVAEVVPNSYQDEQAMSPPQAFLDALCSVAAAFPNPYISIDVAETAQLSQWIVLEAGDGGVSGPGPGQDLRLHWQKLREHFGGPS